MDQQFSLRWNNYLNQITDAFGSLRNEEDLVDVTLSCEGKKLKAHKMLLSACSSYFRNIFKENPCQHPVVVFRNVKFADLRAIIDFIYKGEVNVLQDQLDSFLGTAEMLEVKGLTEGSEKDNTYEEEESDSLNKDEQKDGLEGRKSISKRSAVLKNQQPETEFVPVSTRSTSPLAKKRKTTGTASNHVKFPEVKQKKVVSDIPDLPVEPKIEKEEYIEDLTFEEDEEVGMVHTPRTDSLQLSKHSKQDIVMEFNANLNQSQDQQDSSLLSMGQMLLSEPGTSVESVSQDTMQAVDIAESPVAEDGTVETTSVEELKVILKKENTNLTEEKKYEQVKKSNAKSKPNTSPSKSPSTRVKGDEISKERIVLESKDFEDYIENKIIEKECDSSTSLVLESYSNKNIRAAETVQDNLKPKVNFPKGLTVTPFQKATEVPESIDFTSHHDKPEDSQDVDQAEDFSVIRSEEAKTPVQEEPYGYQSYTDQQSEVFDGIASTGQIIEEEPEMAEEAPELDSERMSPEVPQEEEKEPEFDYYGCEVCKTEAKPCDRFNFTHKCPICPCTCFCSHLLKEHMRVIHGWFNVQRRFKQY